jgi:hypothetical protein
MSYLINQFFIHQSQHLPKTVRAPVSATGVAASLDDDLPDPLIRISHSRFWLPVVSQQTALLSSLQPACAPLASSQQGRSPSALLLPVTKGQSALL